jgi:Protein of unknown function, DUF481
MRLSARIAMLLICVTAGLRAQGPAWERTVDVSGNYLYGNNERLIVSARTGVAINDTLIGARLDARYLIGVGSTDGVRRMDRRSWSISGSVDRRPEDRHSQFVLASVEASLELRVSNRVNAGAGYKYVIDCDTAYQLDASAALVGEWSQLQRETTAPGAAVDLARSKLLRLSNRIRYRNQFTEKVNFDHVTWFRPRIDDWADLLGSSQTSLGYLLSTHASLRLSLQNDYDSRSRARGARSNHNGQILMGVAAKF